MEPALPLAQKLYFLAIRPGKGGISQQSRSVLDYILLGALFMELYLLKKIRFEDKRMVVLNTKAENEVHRFLLLKMSEAKSPRKISRWISKFYYSLKYIRGEVQNGLVDRRLIRMEEKHFLFFKWEKPFVVNIPAQRNLEAEIRELIMKGTRDEEQLILLSFLVPGGLLHRLFSENQQRREARRRLKAMVLDNQVSVAVREAIAAAHAVAASAAAASVAATSAS
ncbi:GPP34 family phosphoprotein [Maribellus sp. YY47]|uniref:GOLPH3/VPS74 family protein n=1 Tax=Maribellus sp. YY47 TaxID=2929486 RepID=UPI002000D722|nr:GPP34 family phosphoprotein [Maribellus sp. YY47]MCK3683298.1 GPP34 family phosphoprotein [Maribellus sp. YY47]